MNKGFRDRIAQFLENNRGYGFTPQQISQQLNIQVNNVYQFGYLNKNKVEKIRVNQRETYYLAK